MQCVSWAETNRVRGARDAGRGAAWEGGAPCSQLSAGQGPPCALMTYPKHTLQIALC